MEPFKQLTSRFVVLPADDVDTDQIIPARFLKVTDKAGLESGLFAEWRKDPKFPLNSAASRGCEILLAGRNFGCGSSREHAPWALIAGGFRAIVALSFADIFRNNALKNGLLPVVVSEVTHRALTQAWSANRDLAIRIDLESQQLESAGFSTSFDIDAFSKHCLTHGIDTLDYLLSFSDKIKEYEETQGLL